jgi:glucose/arabinose dehydrogenase
MMKRNSWLILIASLLVVAMFLMAAILWWNFRANRADPDSANVDIIADHLEIPWALDFLPDGSIVFTERPGRVRLIDVKEDLLSAPLIEIEGVASQGEGGLLGIVVHPDFEENNFIYVYYTYVEEENTRNAVVRYEKRGLEMLEPSVIIDGIPGSSIHNGGRIKFGPDGLLYITTGDASEVDLAQDINSLAGKILRLKDDGSIPADNPFEGSPVYSYGHRNPQGLAWDEDGQLWATEHGSSAHDEINRIVPGANYGWPVIQGDESADNMQSPVVNSGDITWAPSGAAVLDGSLFFAGLRSQSLWRFDLDSGGNPDRYLERRFGRLRAVSVGPEGMLYICTSNRDGRGIPTEDDDLLLRVDPGKLE